MGSQGLTLDCSPPSPKSTGDFLAQVSRMDSVTQKISKLDDYVNRLQDEMKKIDAFKRELPLCMILLNDAIARMKEEIMRCQSSNCEPILEEFIPLKKSSSDKDEKTGDVKETDIVNRREKMNWMSSVQLWNTDSNKKRKEEAVDQAAMGELFRTGKSSRAAGKALSPFKGCSNFLAMTVGKEGRDEFPGAPSLSLRTPEIKNSTEEIFRNNFSSKSSSSRSGSSCGTNSQSSFKADSQQTGRKQRRCWSPELHRRFVSALQQLGGAQAATPKQIRELMQVDGLTNDEVKSHLQKYRLHTRRVPPTANTEGGGGVLGGLWASQEQCGESSKPSNSHSSSPQGPLHLAGSSRGTSVTGGDSVEDEDEDNKSESRSWKSRSSKRESDV
ncbi:transcription factor HHO6-like [Salvia miltiorrhiza]|uniref:transcription factor HHO6-like n=1 Tax=Salvia miltiorrhiza TaxID=226208 RepID=UPI0025AB7859|nr:transcription factor HHO6-like [Salvia miltiorrhiza]